MCIQRYQTAVDLTAVDHPDQGDRLQSLGVGYNNRYRRTGAMADLEMSIKVKQKAVDLTPDDHPDRAGYLQSLGVGYTDRYQETGATMDLEAAIQRHAESLDHVVSPPISRLQSGRLLLTIYADAQNWASANDTAQKTLSLIPLLTSRYLETSDRQHAVSEITDLAANATAVALRADQSPYNALCLLELGRGTITGFLNEMRIDISELYQQHFDVATEFTKLRD